MYTVSVRRAFRSYHHLHVDEALPEASLHPHVYVVTLSLEGGRLNPDGYLADIAVIERELDDVIVRYRDAVLNRMPEFAGINPSIEHLSRVIGDRCAARLSSLVSGAVSVRLEENENAWATYTRHVPAHPVLV